MVRKQCSVRKGGLPPLVELDPYLAGASPPSGLSIASLLSIAFLTLSTEHGLPDCPLTIWNVDPLWNASEISLQSFRESEIVNRESQVVNRESIRDARDVKGNQSGLSNVPSPVRKHVFRFTIHIHN
jgi:hypothetical protein